MADESTGKGVRDYLTLRRGLGFKLVRHEAWTAGVRVLPGAKTQFTHHRQPGIGVGNTACQSQPAEWAARLSIVRGFARHWSATDPLTEVPPLGLLPYRPARAQPYFYSDQEIRKLLKAAKNSAFH